jgi:predicted phosphoadenosine phosphosulfate sulfurtransferase
MSALSVEQRLAALEAEVQRLRRVIDQEKLAPGWKRMVGAFLNDPYFEKAMKYGRQYRESLRPKKATKRKRRHGDS